MSRKGDEALTADESRTIECLRTDSESLLDEAEATRALSKAWQRTAVAPVVHRVEGGAGFGSNKVKLGVLASGVALVAVIAGVQLIQRLPDRIVSLVPELALQDRPVKYPLDHVPQGSVSENLKHITYGSVEEELAHLYGEKQASISAASRALPFRVLVPASTLGRDLTGVYVRTDEARGKLNGWKFLTLLYGTDVEVREFKDMTGRSSEDLVLEEIGNLGPLAGRTTVRGIPASQIHAGTVELTPKTPAEPSGISYGASQVSWIENSTLYLVSSQWGVSADELLVIARSMVPLKN